MKTDEEIRMEYDDLIDILKTYSADIIAEEALELAKKDRQLEAARLMEFAVLKNKRLKAKYSNRISLWKQELDF